jgi:hypothetical protein
MTATFVLGFATAISIGCWGSARSKAKGSGGHVVRRGSSRATGGTVPCEKHLAGLRLVVLLQLKLLEKKVRTRTHE